MKKTTLNIIVLSLVLGSAVWACEYLTVRDSAFQEPRDVHRIVLFADEGDSGIEGIQARVQDWLATKGETVNLEFETVNVRDEEIAWTDYGIPGPPPSTPATALIGSNQKERRNFFIRHWDPAPSTEELEAIVDSPLRKDLSERLLTEIGVLVHVPGTEDKRDDLEELLAGIEASWDAKEKAGVSRITLNRKNPEERLALSFLGIPEEGPDWVGILFGRGKAMDPWMGEEINDSQLNGQLETLIGECSCLTTASGLGVDLPMVWTAEMEEKMVPLREPIEEEEPTALAGMRGSSLGSGPLLLLGALFSGVLLVGGGLFVVRSRRQGGPLVTHTGG